MCTDSEAVFAVDRIEGELAVLLGADGAVVEVQLTLLPAGISEGMVLVVTLGEGAEPDWKTARIDAEEETRRRETATQLLNGLKKRDPGGDISL